MTKLPHARQEDLVVCELPDEVLVYDLKNNHAHCLNSTAAVVWRYCDGKRTVAELVKVVAQELRAPFDEQVVQLALAQLGKRHLLRERSATQGRVSRRELVQRLGFATLLLPVIFSINAPTALAQGSCAGLNGDCTSVPCCSGQGLTCYQGSCCNDLLPGSGCTSGVQCCSGICVSGICE